MDALSPASQLRHVFVSLQYAKADSYSDLAEEARFYRVLAPMLGTATGVHLPTCYVASDKVLLMRDEVRSPSAEGDGTRHVGDDDVGCTREDAARALRSLASVHARFWKADVLATEYVVEPPRHALCCCCVASVRCLTWST